MSLLFAGSSAEALLDPAVAQLSAWGYPVPACMEALQRLKGDPDAAHQDLFVRLSGALLRVLLLPAKGCLTSYAQPCLDSLFTACAAKLNQKH